MLSDLELIQAFVQDSIASKEPLLANSALQAMKVGCSNQLISKKEGVIVTALVGQGHPSFNVQFDSIFCESVSQVLAEAGFLPNDDVQDKGYRGNKAQLLKYWPYKLPKHYFPHCTQAISLWKMWWRYARRIRHQCLPMDLVIRRRHTWHPIKDISVAEGLIYVATLREELLIHSEDLIFWLNKKEVTSPPLPSKAPSRRAM